MPIIATINEDQPTELEKRLLVSLVFTSSLDADEKEEMMNRINGCTDYKHFERLQWELEEKQENIQNIPNPSQKDISNHLRRIV